MTYPKAPWKLQGYGFQTLHGLDIDRVCSLIPSSLELVPVLPQKTLGGVYVASYKAGSTIIYNELIVVSAIVYCKGKVGAWISHIYVDHPASIEGGREIWGLPKEFAHFTWDQTSHHPSVQITQGDQVLCTLNCKDHWFGLLQPVFVPCLSTLHSNLITFEGQGSVKWHIANIDLDIPSQSHFAWLNMGRPGLSFYLRPLHLVANMPSVLKQEVSL